MVDVHSDDAKERLTLAETIFLASGAKALALFES